MEYYSALAKRRRLEKQALSVVAAPSSLSSQTRKSSRLLFADDAKFKCDEPTSITTTHEDKKNSLKDCTDTSSRRGKERVSISDEVEVRTISHRKSPRLLSNVAKSNSPSENERDDSDDYDSDEDEELGNYIYKNSRTAQYFQEETKLASALLSKTLRKSPRLISAATKSNYTEEQKQTTKYPIGTRMAKEYFIEDRKVTELCYGSITGYNSDDNSYSVLYDDGDKEEISEDEIAILVNNATSEEEEEEEEEEAPKRIGTRLDDATLGAPSSTTTTKSSNYGIKRHINTDGRGTKRNLSEEAVAPMTSRKSSRRSTAAKSAGVPSSEEIGATTIATRRVVRKNGRARALCSTAGCINLAVNEGVCTRHGAPRKVCTHKGCKTQVINNGVCCRHGAKMKICNIKGCTKQAQNMGVCKRHGAKQKICSHKGCNHKARLGGVCTRHGAKRKICSHVECTNIAVSIGVCYRHGATRNVCSHAGCSNNAIESGVCIRHGAKKRTCSYKGCNNGAIKLGVCIRHGAKRRTCSQEGCNNGVKSKGLCFRHGAPRKKCSNEGCSNISVSKGVCKRHGALKKSVHS